MDKAFVLINCKPGKEPSIIEQLRGIKNVIDAQETFGAYDIVARIESTNQSQLDNIISDQIRKLDDVNSTLTLIPTEHQEGLTNLIPDIIPDIIPEQKKPLEEQDSEHEEESNEEYEEEEYEEE
ncbi:MAG: Lrp/AsnC ligand binding domain-containing protein [Nitrosopumilus sp.]|nr:Lrp/AsnC ligand binding domain-containing protein [Nitrosopumilus sp.]MBL7017792.1 Lrp/AsnC ligand binding domain-containing protein [Nitrosopumilus sp.]